MKKMDAAEMRMSRWEIELTRGDKARNEITWSALGVKAVSTGARESQLRWCGHVKRREEWYV